VFEVEAAHPVDHGKLANYCELYWALDDWEWRLGLITIDEWGRVTSLVDMTAVRLAQLELEALRSKYNPTEQEITEARSFMERFRELNPHLYEATSRRHRRQTPQSDPRQGDLFR
jgi:FtsZ-binding cell division protein ZapB